MHKLPATVAGRCQVFHLKKIPSHLIIQRIKKILDKEGISYDLPSLKMVADSGQGSMRDALTFLDQVVVLSGNKLDVQIFLVK